MQAGCLYGPVGTSGPKTRVTVSSPASSELPAAIMSRQKERTRTTVDFMEWALVGRHGNSRK